MRRPKRVWIFLCRSHWSFAFFGYKDKYYPFGFNLGFWGMRFRLREPTFISDKGGDRDNV